MPLQSERPVVSAEGPRLREVAHGDESAAAQAVRVFETLRRVQAYVSDASDRWADASDRWQPLAGWWHTYMRILAGRRSNRAGIAALVGCHAGW